jgi:hypothetical protein
MSKLIFYLSLMTFASCVQKSDYKGSDSDSVGLDASRNASIAVDDVNSEMYVYCQQHSDYCGLLADENDLTLDDYHYNQELYREDAMTDENGDIVDPDAIINDANALLYVNDNADISNTSESTFNAWQCTYCASISRKMEEPSGGDFGGHGGCSISGNHYWHRVNTNGGGRQCHRCGTTSYINIGREPCCGEFGGHDGCHGGSPHRWTRF